MIRSLFTAATGMHSQQMNVDVIAHNLANVNTVGFKRSRADFQDLLYQNIKGPGAVSGEGVQVPTGIQVGLGVKPVAVQKLFTQGDFINTNNELDLVIEGGGFFQVTRPDGTTAYTRSGAFKLDKDGRMVTSDGYPLTDGITFDPSTTSITISATGEVSAFVAGSSAPTALTPITIAKFANPAGLMAIGKNLFTTSDASGEAVSGAPGLEGRGTLNQGFLEMSNVNVVEEMANLIIAQRAFDINSKAVQASDEMLQISSNIKR
ncbi:MAG: flagellar basal-body rod protein FlgG [Nitrospirae bacterium]|nr:flagellar basal-body rod protein FlgG [Nitrospirota bacterium]